MFKLKVSVIGLIFSLVLHAGIARADGRIYITNEGNSTVSVANLDGTGAKNLGNLNGTLDVPTCIALDTTHGKMYVGNASGTVSVANLDGTGAQVLNPQDWSEWGLPQGIALDTIHGKMYAIMIQPGGPVNIVCIANLDGTGGEVISPLPYILAPTAIAVDVAGGKIYAVDGDLPGPNPRISVSVGNLDCTGWENLGNLNNTLTGNYEDGVGIALDTAGGKMYVVDGKTVTGNTVIVANLDGTDGESLGDLNGTLNYPGAIAVDAAGGKMYVVNGDANDIATEPGTVSVANLDGTGGESLGDLNGTLSDPAGIAVGCLLYPLRFSKSRRWRQCCAISAGDLPTWHAGHVDGNPCLRLPIHWMVGRRDGNAESLTVAMNKDMSINTNFAPINSLATTATVTGMAGNNGWYVSNIGISFSAFEVKEICTKLDNRAMTATAGSAAL